MLKADFFSVVVKRFRFIIQYLLIYLYYYEMNVCNVHSPTAT